MVDGGAQIYPRRDLLIDCGAQEDAEEFGTAIVKGVVCCVVDDDDGNDGTCNEQTQCQLGVIHLTALKMKHSKLVLLSLIFSDPLFLS